jgi:hypothetical protein
MRRTLGLLFFLSVSCTTWAQNAATDSSSPTTPPVNVSIDPFAIPAICESNPIVIRMRNEGTKPLRGYVVGLFFPDPKGSGVPHVVTYSEVVNPPNPAEKLLAPGAEWERTVCKLPPGIAPTSVSVKVDLLGFEDGSKWGPAELRESHTTLGALDATNYFLGQTDVAKLLAPVHLDIDSAAEEVSSSISTDGPLKFTPFMQHGSSGQDLLTVQVTNVTDTPVRGYVFKTSFFDHATGALIKRIATMTLEMSDDPSAYLSRGVIWGAPSRKVPLSSDHFPADYKLSVDIAVFGDESTFYPVKSGNSDQLLATVQVLGHLKSRQNSQKRAQGLP